MCERCSLWFSFRVAGSALPSSRCSPPQSCVAILLFESVNYIEHYGLERAVLPSGEYEDIGYRHSWDSAHQLTNMLLFKLQRHGDHHVHGGKRFQW